MSLLEGRFRRFKSNVAARRQVQEVQEHCSCQEVGSGGSRTMSLLGGRFKRFKNNVPARRQILEVQEQCRCQEVGSRGSRTTSLLGGRFKRFKNNVPARRQILEVQEQRHCQVVSSSGSRTTSMQEVGEKQRRCKDEGGRDFYIKPSRSREARRLKENQIALRAAFLEKQNTYLKVTLKNLNIENASIKVGQQFQIYAYILFF